MFIFCVITTKVEFVRQQKQIIITITLMTNLSDYKQNCKIVQVSDILTFETARSFR